ncbi:MAG: glutaredoxin family protein, partial [Streptosporangiaceae bacterium]
GSQWSGQAGYGAPAAWPGDAGYPGEPGYAPAGSPGFGYDMAADLRYPGLAALVAEDEAAAPGRAVAAGRRQGPDWYATEPGHETESGYGAEFGRGAEGGYGPSPSGRPVTGEAGYGPATGSGPDEGGDEDWDDDAGAGQRRSAAPDPHARLFGQIVIYSLAEDQAEEFDRLTERLVSAVQANEPDTLVYIVHQVPTAPLQRILYEVYLDRPAFEDHLRQPYVLRYDEQRQPLVAAMNVIELGLQQAKVSPFPTISEILTESGIDLTGVTRSRRGTRRRHSRQPGPESPDRAAGHDRGSLAGQASVPAPDPGGPAPDPGGPAPAPGAPAHSVLLLSRPGCHLCEDARSVVEKVTAELGVRWTERDITVSEQDLRDYGDMIPVVFVDGVQHDFWRVDADRLRIALSG